MAGRGTEDASGDLLAQSGHETEDLLAIHQGHIDESQIVLALHHRLQVVGLDLVLGHEQMASLAVLQIGVEFLSERGPARERGVGEGGLSRVLLPHTHPSGTRPGSRRFDNELLAFHDEDRASLPRDVVGDGVANDPSPNDQHLNTCCGCRHAMPSSLT